MEADTTASLYNFYGWVVTNRKQVVAGAIAVAVLASGITLWVWHNDQREADASQELLAIPSLSPMADPGDHLRKDDLVKIAQDYPATLAGANAQLLAARASFLDGKYQQSEQEFAKFVTDHSGSELVPEAQVGVAASLEGEGKIPEAIAKYKLVETTYQSYGNIIIPVKMTLGRLSEATGKLDAAFNYYEQLARQQNPYDPWVVEAGERLRLLVSAHPELMPKNPTSPPTAPSASGLLNPSAADTQIAPPSAGTETPKPAATTKPAEPLPPIELPGSGTPAAKP